MPKKKISKENNGKTRYSMYIDRELLNSFKKKCIDSGVFYSNQIRQLMKDWLKN